MLGQTIQRRPSQMEGAYMKSTGMIHGRVVGVTKDWIDFKMTPSGIEHTVIMTTPASDKRLKYLQDVMNRKQMVSLKVIKK